MTNFVQIPYWDENAEFKLTGEEFSMIMQLSSVIESIFNRHIESGVLKIKYEDEKGNEVSQQDIMKFLQDKENKKPSLIL